MMIIGSVEKMNMLIAGLSLNQTGLDEEQSSCGIMALDVKLQSCPTYET